MLIAVGISLVCALGACGGGTEPSASPSTFSTAMVGSREFGFSLRYPAEFVKVEPAVSASTQPGLLYQVYMADPDGAMSGEVTLDVLGLAVYRMNKAAGPGDVSRHKREFRAVAANLVEHPEGLRIMEPFGVTELAGHEALKGIYSYRVGDANVAVVAYLIPVGERAYWVTGQASRQTWESTGRILGSAIATLRLDGSD
jgi:hypothetical protein